MGDFRFFLIIFIGLNFFAGIVFGFHQYSCGTDGLIGKYNIPYLLGCELARDR